VLPVFSEAMADTYIGSYYHTDTSLVVKYGFRKRRKDGSSIWPTAGAILKRLKNDLRPLRRIRRSVEK